MKNETLAVIQKKLEYSTGLSEIGPYDCSLRILKTGIGCYLSTASVDVHER